MLPEMASVVVYDLCAPLERVVLEFRVIPVEAVELRYMAGVALLVGDLAQLEIGALMLLVAGCAVEATCDHVIGREGGVLRAGPMWRWCTRSDFRQPLGALLQHLRRSAMRVVGRVRHLVAAETGLAVGERIAADDAVHLSLPLLVWQALQFSIAA
jgi:hypothetical protein